MRLYSIFIFFLLSCSITPLSNNRIPASEEKLSSCNIALRDFFRGNHKNFKDVNDFLNDKEIEKYSKLVTFYDNEKIEYNIILDSTTQKNLVELTPTPNGHPINRYAYRVHRRFAGTRIFINADINASIRGSYSPAINRIFLSRDVGENILDSGFVTLVHEARHAMFSHQIEQGIDSEFLGSITPLNKGSEIEHLTNTGYENYVSFEESRTWFKDSVNYYNLMMKKLSDESSTEEIEYIRNRLGNKTSDSDDLFYGLDKLFAELKDSDFTIQNLNVTKVIASENIEISLLIKDNVFRLNLISIDENIIKGLKRDKTKQDALDYILLLVKEKIQLFRIANHVHMNKVRLLRNIISNVQGKNLPNNERLFQLKFFKSIFKFNNTTPLVHNNFEIELSKFIKNNKNKLDEEYNISSYSSDQIKYLNNYLQNAKKQVVKINGEKFIRLRVKDSKIVFVTDMEGNFSHFALREGLLEKIF